MKSWLLVSLLLIGAGDDLASASTPATGPTAAGARRSPDFLFSVDTPAVAPQDGPVVVHGHITSNTAGSIIVLFRGKDRPFNARVYDDKDKLAERTAEGADIFSPDDQPEQNQGRYDVAFVKS